HEDEPAHTGTARRGNEVARAVDHDPLELLLPPLADRHEVDDRVAPLDRTGEAQRVSHVPFEELDVPGAKLSALSRTAHERPHLLAGGTQGVYDVPPDEAGRAGDEDQRAGSRWKFCQ